MISNQDILAFQSNRGYPVPDAPWKYCQEWRDNIFMHWQVDTSFLRDAVPAELQLDLFEGKAWISLVAFSVRDMQLRHIPPVSLLSDFHELNIRTYVVHDGIPGIYFLTINAQKLIPVLMARIFIGLPYRKARIRRQGNRYRAYRKAHSIDLRYSVKKPIHRSDLDLWLTERHALFEQRDTDKSLFRIDIHHYPWLLKKADVQAKTLTYPFLNGLGGRCPDKVHFSSSVKVLLWGRTQV